MSISITQRTSGPLFTPGLPAKIISDNMRSAVAEALLVLERFVKNRTPVGVLGDSGLRGSIFGEMKSGSALEIMGVVGSPLPYAEGVELGAKPHMPNITSLNRWVEKNLGFTGKEGESITWAIAMTIKRRGTKGKFMFEKGLEDSLDTLDRIFQEMGFDMVVELNKEQN